MGGGRAYGRMGRHVVVVVLKRENMFLFCYVLYIFFDVEGVGLG